MHHPSVNPLASLLLSRRSPKLTTLSEPGPDADQLATILTIAARVPDHGQLAPWRFITILGSRRLELGNLIGTVFDAANPAAENAAKDEARRRMTYAPLVVGVVFCPRSDPTNPARPHPKIPEWEQILSAGAACMNMIVAANALGFAAVWLTEWYAFNPMVLAHLGLSPNERIAGFIHIGTPTEARDDRKRPLLADIVKTY